MLAIRNLHKRFVLHPIGGRIVVALRGIDLDVGEGEHVALAGPSGAGKSSLLKCVYRTYVASAGAVLFAKSDSTVVDLARIPDREMAALRGREIGYVSQFLRSEPRRSTLDTVISSGVRRGMSLTEATVAARATLHRVGLGEELWPVYPTLLSGGERQRVNLAAGLINPPRLLLLDEPISALDPVSRDGVLGLIEELAQKQVAVLSVFHDMEAIARVARRVVWLRDGRVHSVGQAADALAVVR